MKLMQYVRQEKAIAAADAGGIRDRWLWGLRVLRDPQAMASSKSLKHGVAERLIGAAAKAGLKLSATEIRYRIQCARTYPTDDQIANAVGDFGTWHDLIQAGFPAYDAAPGEPPADHRDKAEKDHDRARALLDLTGEQGLLFPLAQFEPAETTLKELADYCEEQEELTARFVAHGQTRRDYLDRLIEAADGDLSTTWADAHDRLPPDDGPDRRVTPMRGETWT